MDDTQVPRRRPLLFLVVTLGLIGGLALAAYLALGKGVQSQVGISTEKLTGLTLHDSALAMSDVSTRVSNESPRRNMMMEGEAMRYAGAPPPDFNTEEYDHLVENVFRLAQAEPLSTFSIDVDTASYSNTRRFLQQGRRPPVDAVRIEELINYFDYDYPQPEGDAPFSVNVEVAQCPWAEKHYVAAIGLKGRDIAAEQRPAGNFVFLLDVSGSMNEPNKLPLLKQSLRLLTENMNDEDRIAITVYAGAAGLVLPSTPGDQRRTIIDAFEALSAGGSTAGGAGIELAYSVAQENFIEGGINRVILCTDGDFNVGVSSQGELTRLIEEKAKSGVFLSVLGFGMGNYSDARLEKLADQGNGNYAYIDTLAEARKVLVKQLSGTLVTIAKDVKIQVEFNPAEIAAYRLIGYENRMLAAQDFNDDKKDAGEIGAGHTVTALYELVPVGVEIEVPGVDPLKYQTVQLPTDRGVGSGEMLTAKLRYKAPDGDESRLIEVPVAREPDAFASASENLRFASAVAAFGMLLRESPQAGTATFDLAYDWGRGALGRDADGYRVEFLTLVKKAAAL